MLSQGILVTSIGSKTPLLSTLRKAIQKYNENILLHGADSNSLAIGQYFVDTFWHIPTLDVLTIDDIINYCKQNNIHHIIPTRDGELRWFASSKKSLEAHGISLFCSDLKALESTLDKWAFSQTFAHHKVIPTALNLEQLSAQKYVVKERYGSGSMNQLLNATYEEAQSFALGLNSPIFQPFIEGKEYSIDSYIDIHSNCITSLVRSRDVIVQGEAKVTTLVDNPKIISVVEKLLKELSPYGHVVTQVLENDDGIFIIECNLRFGGASTLSSKAGLESFYWFLSETSNRPIIFERDTTIKKQIRIEKDIYFGY